MGRGEWGVGDGARPRELCSLRSASLARLGATAGYVLERSLWEPQCRGAGWRWESWGPVRAVVLKVDAFKSTDTQAPPPETQVQ